MAKMISMDLRTRLVAAVQDGSSRRAAAVRFGVSASCAVKLLGRVHVVRRGIGTQLVGDRRPKGTH